MSSRRKAARKLLAWEKYWFRYHRHCTHNPPGQLLNCRIVAGGNGHAEAIDQWVRAKGYRVTSIYSGEAMKAIYV